MAVYDPDGTTDFAKMLTMVNTDKVWAEPARLTARAHQSRHGVGDPNIE
jgi:para-nitrobenzyl esterase